MVAIPLSEKFLNESAIGRMAKKIAGVSVFISAPLVGATHAVNVLAEHKLSTTLREPIGVIIEVPETNIPKIIETTCEKTGKTWTDFVAIGLKPRGGIEPLVKAAVPCILGKLR